MKGWRQRQSCGVATVPSTGIEVLTVTDGGGGDALWTFNGLATLGAGSSAALEMEDPDNPGTWLQPTAVAQVAGNQIGATYTTAFSAPTGWRILSQPASIAAAVTVPQSGTTT